MWPFNRGRSLKDALDQTKDLKINGVLFKIKKIDSMAYIEGFKVMQQIYDTYQQAKESDSFTMSSAHMKKARKHYAEVFVAGVVKPELSLKKDDGEKIHVDELFKDQDLYLKLYEEIMKLTYGKKKVQP